MARSRLVLRKFASEPSRALHMRDEPSKAILCTRLPPLRSVITHQDHPLYGNLWTSHSMSEEKESAALRSKKLARAAMNMLLVNHGLLGEAIFSGVSCDTTTFS